MAGVMVLTTSPTAACFARACFLRWINQASFDSAMQMQMQMPRRLWPLRTPLRVRGQRFLVRRISAAQWPPFFDPRGDEYFELLLLGGIARDIGGHFTRHDHHAVHVRDDDVARMHRHAAARD